MPDPAKGKEKEKGEVQFSNQIPEGCVSTNVPGTSTYSVMATDPKDSLTRGPHSGPPSKRPLETGHSTSPVPPEDDESQRINLSRLKFKRDEWWDDNF